MRRIFTAAAMAVAMFTSVMAQTVRIETKQGVKNYDLSEIVSISFSDEKNTEELVSVEVMNMSPLAFDLKVEKSASCQKYMAAVYSKNIYNESVFIANAEQTLQPDAYFKPFSNTLSYESKTFSESQLGLNTLASDDKEAAYVAAIYAIDDLGTAKVYTKEFSLPTTISIESSETATVTIDESTFAYNHFDYTIRCGWNTKKVIYAVTSPSYFTPKMTMDKFEALSFEQQQEKLLKMYQSLPVPYESVVKGSHKCNSNEELIVYAIPIDSEGKIGTLGIKTVRTGEPVMNGEGKFTGVSFNQNSYESAQFYVSVDNNVASYRLMWVSTHDFETSFKDILPQVFSSEEYEEIGTWTEFDADEMSVSLDVIHPGDAYVLYGVTVDGRGRISKPVNLLQEFMETPSIETMKEEEAPAVDFNGVGTCSVEVTEKMEDGMYNVDYTVTKGENTSKVLVFILSGMESDIEAEIKDRLTDYPEDYFPRQEFTFASSDSETASQSMMEGYDAKYGGSILVFVTVDNNGALKIDKYYSPKLGVKSFK